ncbi:hypothetical protein lacNasYZ03_10590 [Lactobacillus nasalidis]|uniref:Uncharacterized protein n=1 Tax=Lactobacillus nasalidis TaxID=2797258 RepID=A0ABQ3WAY9_9LACO|nr:hypothetical protein [Lactobacillus nasalidis]GHV97760.1 hypothetical protein lacNasYZ01_09420 [Lactobacillus nasalidis]GHW00231.1 hypothetical protein lacNasYZ02_16600 [Lactobacillus nasalidis]GHW01372.1 hypothetical protein lacNasYZ03_10590 [Lactobacillus nasalidis]
MINGTVKMLLENYLAPFLEEEDKIGRKTVDVKKGRIRIFDTPKTLHCSIQLDDVGLTEQEAVDLINHERLNLALAGSSHPITENWKASKF